MIFRRVPLSELHQDPGNVRAHGERNMAAIRDSLRRFGQAEPLVVQKGTGRVIGGNGRLAAMQSLGWTECDIVEVELDDRKARALGLALNRTAELAEWNMQALATVLQELQVDDDLDGVGFTNEDIDALIADIEANTVQPGEVDDPGPAEPTEQAISRLGDLWLLGNHRLLCGDSTSEADVGRLLAGDKPSLLSTDPPYCVDYTGAERPQESGKDWSDKYHEVEIADLGEFLRSVLKTVLPHLQPDAAIYVWHAHLQYPTIDRVFEEFGILRHQPIIWSKASSTFTYSYYRWAHETCLFGWRQGHKPPHYLENGLSTVWEADWEGKARSSTFHPTSKPVRLFEIPMEQHTKPGAVVLEPFCGSGSQLIAAEKLGRRCRAMEISPPFVDGAVLRWQTATGKQATLEGDGRTFAEVAAERGESKP